MNEKILEALLKGPKTAGQLATRLRKGKLMIYRALQGLVSSGRVAIRGTADEKRRGPKARIYGRVH